MKNDLVILSCLPYTDPRGLATGIEETEEAADPIVPFVPESFPVRHGGSDQMSVVEILIENL